MRLAPSNWDQLKFRSADVQVRSLVDRNVWFVAQNIVGTESLPEELLPEDLWPVEFLFEFFLVVASPVKLGTRVQPAEVGVTAHMVPVCVSNEHGRQRRQSWRKGLQCLICTFCEVRAGARVNADEVVSVLRNNEVVFREFEAGQRVNSTGNHLGNPPWRKRMTRGFVLRKWRCQRDRVIEIGIAAAPQVLLGLCCIAVIQREFAEVIINFPQPGRMRRFVCVLKTPSEFLLCSRSLVKVAWEFRMHDAGDPVQDENFAT